MMSEVEEVATDTSPTKLPANSQKDEGNMVDLLCTSATSAVHDELGSYLTCTDCGPDVLSLCHRKEDTWSKLSMCAKWILLSSTTSFSNSERAFSVSHMAEHWTTATIDRLQFLHAWLVRCQQAYRVAQINGAILSHCKYSENSMTELRENW